jgi:hypothetical protein
MSQWPMVPLREVLQLQRRWIKPYPTETYREIGIRSFGKPRRQGPLPGALAGRDDQMNTGQAVACPVEVKVQG